MKRWWDREPWLSLILIVGGVAIYVILWWGSEDRSLNAIATILTAAVIFWGLILLGGWLLERRDRSQ